MKPNLPYSKALIGLAGWVGLLAIQMLVHVVPNFTSFDQDSELC